MNRLLKLIFGIFLVVQVWMVAPSTRLHPEPMSIAFVVVPIAGLRRRRDILRDEEDVEDEDNLQYGSSGQSPGRNTFGRASPFGFTGRWGGYSDARLGNVLNWNRWYGPEAGRWVSRDPIGIRGGNNLYSYISNSPILMIDPNGLSSTSKWKPKKYPKGSCLGNWVPHPEDNNFAPSIATASGVVVAVGNVISHIEPVTNDVGSSVKCQCAWKCEGGKSKGKCIRSTTPEMTDGFMVQGFCACPAPGPSYPDN